MVIKILVIVGLVSIVACGMLFENRNRSALLGALLGLVLGPIGLVVALAVPVRKLSEGEEKNTVTISKMILAGMVGALLVQFLSGMASGIIDFHEGQNIMGYNLKCKSLEPISGVAYQLYFELFSDLSTKREEMRGALDELGVDADE